MHASAKQRLFLSPVGICKQAEHIVKTLDMPMRLLHPGKHMQYVEAVDLTVLYLGPSMKLNCLMVVLLDMGFGLIRVRTKSCIATTLACPEWF